MRVSVLIPVYGDKQVDNTIKSVVDQHFEAYEILILHNGIKDLENTVQIKEDANIRYVYIKDKGKGHALNVGLSLVKYDYIVTVDADCELAPGAVNLAADKLKGEIVAVGGKICVKGNSLLELVQTIEYERAFNITRKVYDWLNCNIIISGAFGVFDKNVLLGVGGYAEDTVGEDMELVLRLQKGNRGVAYAPEAKCYTKVPDNICWLMRQRDRWQRGMLDSLWRHKDLFLNVRHGVLGLLCIPYQWVIEFVGPIRIIVIQYLFGLTGVLYYLVYIVLVSVLGDYIELGKKAFAPERIFVVVLLTLSGCLLYAPISLARIYGMITYQWRKNIW